MGSLTRTIGNSFTTSGVIKSSAIDNTTLSNVSALPAAIPTGSMVLLSTQTASGDASISFTTGIDSTYKEYMFIFNNIHGSAASDFQMNFSTDGGSNYNVTKTTTAISAYHSESDAAPDAYYIASHDLAQSTSPKKIMGPIYNDNDNSGSGYLHLFDPSNTTFVKHFISSTQRTDNATSNNFYTAGYGNTTSAINAVQFTMASGNIDDGTIQLFGIK